MSEHRIYWGDDAHTVLVCEHYENVNYSWDSVYRMVEERLAYLEGVHHKVYTIYRFYDRNIVRKDAIDHLHRLFYTAHPNECGVLFVQPPTMLRHLLQITNQLYKIWPDENFYHFFDDSNEAFTYIREQQQHLSHL